VAGSSGAALVVSATETAFVRRKAVVGRGVAAEKGQQLTPGALVPCRSNRCGSPPRGSCWPGPVAGRFELGDTVEHGAIERGQLFGGRLGLHHRQR
jgi:hypothetical protein